MDLRSHVLGTKSRDPVPFQFKGETLWVRQMTVADSQRVQERAKSMPETRVSIFTIVDLVVDETGKAVFSPADEALLAALSLEDFRVLADAVGAVVRSAVESGAKKSEASPDVSSSTP